MFYMKICKYDNYILKHIQSTIVFFLFFFYLNVAHWGTILYCHQDTLILLAVHLMGSQLRTYKLLKDCKQFKKKSQRQLSNIANQITNYNYLTSRSKQRVGEREGEREGMLSKHKLGRGISGANLLTRNQKAAQLIYVMFFF